MKFLSSCLARGEIKISFKAMMMISKADVVLVSLCSFVSAMMPTQDKALKQFSTAAKYKCREQIYLWTS